MGRDFSSKALLVFEKLEFPDRMRAFLILTAIIEIGVVAWRLFE